MYEIENEGYNSSIFGIEPKGHIIPCRLDIEHTYLSHDNYKVYNIGFVDIYVELLHGTSEKWETVAEHSIVKPGQTVIFDNVGKLFRVTGIKISNKTDVRAVVYCALADYSLRGIQMQLNVFDKGYSNNLKDTYSVGVKHIPSATKKFQGLYEAFWPSDKLNVWEEILLKLQPLLKDDILQVTSVTINKFMRKIQQKLYTLSRNFEKGLAIRDMYMEIATELCEFEKTVIIKQSNCSTINMILLPLYSNIVLLKTTFYALGIITSSDLRFSPDDISRIDNYIKATKEATKYINNILHDRLTQVYNNSRVEDLYDSMMNVRSYIAIHGTEFTRIWDGIVRNPFTGEQMFNDVISYSNFFGKQTPNLIREATAKKMYPPLTPLYIGFIYNYLTAIEVYLWMNPLSELRKIGGMKLTFADHSSYIMGTKTEMIEQLDFMKAHITKLQVTGTGAIDSCTFHMSDGRTLFFGSKENGSEEEIFELKGHRIVSIFLSSDDDSLGGQAANIAVSYRLNNA